MATPMCFGNQIRCRCIPGRRLAAICMGLLLLESSGPLARLQTAHARWACSEPPPTPHGRDRSGKRPLKVRCRRSHKSSPRASRMTPTPRPEGFLGRPRVPDKILGDKMARRGRGSKLWPRCGAAILPPVSAGPFRRPRSCLEPGGGPKNSPDGGWGISGGPGRDWVALCGWQERAMFRNNASGDKIWCPGRISAGF
jgi:hypothetical protein